MIASVANDRGFAHDSFVRIRCEGEESPGFAGHDAG